jgi:UPF0716 protein FxsA
MDPAPSIIYVAFAEHKAPALPIRLLPFIPLAWFILEVVVLVEVGQAVGALAVVALLFAAAIAGGLLLRHAGTSVVSSLLVRNPSDRKPALQRLRSAGWQVAAGLLLIVPGFASDVVALLLFLPPVRRLLSAMLPKPTHVRTRSTVIEGEFHDISPDPEPTTTPRFPRPGETDGERPADVEPAEGGPSDGDANPWSRRDRP